MSNDSISVFKPCPMPAEQYITLNGTHCFNNKRVPFTPGWRKWVIVDPPDHKTWYKWIRSYSTDPSIQMSCLCPSKFSFDRRLSADPEALCYWLGLDFDSPKAPTLEALIPQLSAFAGFYYTTKSHQKAGHDRYRVMMAYSRPVTHSENLRIHGVLALKIHHDKRCGDLTRIFWPSIQGCTSGGLGGTNSVDVEHLLSVAADMGIGSSIKSTKSVKSNRRSGRSFLSKRSSEYDWESCSINTKLRNRLLQIWNLRYRKTCLSGEVNTRDAIWALMHRSLEETIDLPEIAITMESLPFFADWVKRKGENYREKLIEVYDEHIERESAVLKEYHPIHPISHLVANDLPPIDDDYRKVLESYRKLKGYPVTPLHDTTHRALLSLSSGKHVLDIGCGLEKSVGASVLASVSNRPVWLVCEHHSACRDAIERLREMGTNMDDVAYIPGYNSATCKMYEHNRSMMLTAKNMYNHSTTPCRKCTNRNGCDFAMRLFHFKKCTQRRIVVMTHSMFVLKFEPWQQSANENGFSPDTLVIIDEQLKRWETGSFTIQEIEEALEYANIDPRPILGAINDAVRSSNPIKVDGGRRTLGGVGVMSDDASITSRSSAISILNGKNLDEELVNRCIEIITLLCSGKIHYIMQNEKIHILTDKNAWSMPDNCIMLDGSARFTQVQWEGFSFWNIETPNYNGLTVHVMRGNATKSGMYRVSEAFEHHVESIRTRTNPKRVVHAVNKLKHDIAENYIPVNPNDMVAQRGTGTRGSNDYINCDMIIMRMALFTDVNDYALRAALGSQGAIDANDIWLSNGPKSGSKSPPRPNMSKHGFIHPSLQIAAHRQTVDELYQAILRIGVRKYDGGKYTAICTLPDDLSVALLGDLLPGAEIIQHNFDESKDRHEKTRSAKITLMCQRAAIK